MMKIFKVILACVLGVYLQLLLHEAGHALFAIITGNKVVDINIGILSYANINVVNEWSIPIISIGSFVFPIIVCIVLSLFKSEFVKFLNISILTITTIQLAINAVAILVEKNASVLATYDIGICVNFGLNNVFLSIISCTVCVVLLVWICFKFKNIAENL